MPAKLKRDWQQAAATLGLPTTGTKREIAQRVTQFGYNAIEDKGRRQAPQTRTKHEIKILTGKKAKKLQATAQEQMRNHALLGWMVRKHLDYVSRFHVSIRTGKDGIDSLLNRILKWHGSPRNLDIAGRLGRDEMFRLFELEKVVNGDAGLIKLPDLKLQGLESDLIAKPGDYKPEDHGGVVINDRGMAVDESTGRRLQFCVCNRGKGDEIKLDHLEPAENVIFDGYWSRFTSQCRGVSPLASALNTVQDIAEGCEFNLVKAKMHALFGLAVMRDAGGEEGFGGAGGATAETGNASATSTDEELVLNPTDVNILDMNPGEKVEVLESGTPSSEFVEGTHLFIHLAMLSLDIPVTCFDSRRSSFSARIADLNEYEVSCDGKRTKNRYVRQEYSNWLLATIWNTPGSDWRLDTVAKNAGMNLRDVQEAVEWVPAGSPWLDKLKQVTGDEKAIELHLDNPIDAARRRGADVFKNIDKKIQVEKYEREQRAAELGDAPSPPPEPEDGDNE